MNHVFAQYKEKMGHIEPSWLSAIVSDHALEWLEVIVGKGMLMVPILG